MKIKLKTSDKFINFKNDLENYCKNYTLDSGCWIFYVQAYMGEITGSVLTIAIK